MEGKKIMMAYTGTGPGIESERLRMTLDEVMERYDEYQFEKLREGAALTVGCWIPEEEEGKERFIQYLKDNHLDYPYKSNSRAGTWRFGNTVYHLSSSLVRLSLLNVDQILIFQEEYSPSQLVDIMTMLVDSCVPDREKIQRVKLDARGERRKINFLGEEGEKDEEI